MDVLQSWHRIVLLPGNVKIVCTGNLEFLGTQEVDVLEAWTGIVLWPGDLKIVRLVHLQFLDQSDVKVLFLAVEPLELGNLQVEVEADVEVLQQQVDLPAILGKLCF
ncbi:unnamed protein product [Calypogeia fissa]